MTCTDYRIRATSTNKWLHHFVHATLYTTILLVYPLLTTSTLYWITTNTSTAYSTRPSCSLLHWLLTLSTYHNLGFIHIYSHSFILHIILPFIKPKWSFFLLTLKFSCMCLTIKMASVPLSFHKSELHIIYLNLLQNSVFKDPFIAFCNNLILSKRSTLHWVTFPFVNW